MKNKYLNKFFCITMLSAMVLAVPTGVKAAEEADNVVAEEGVSGDGSEVSEPEPEVPEVPAEPVPTAAPEPEITAAPDPEPTTAPEPTDTPAPAPTETPEPTATPAPTAT
ncbi:MAG: hydrolase, partial [Ruminococcus sp.]|nr:hydrolase [Ruminococcus sp.]